MSCLFFISVITLSMAILIWVSKPIILECIKNNTLKKIREQQERNNNILKDYSEREKGIEKRIEDLENITEGRSGHKEQLETLKYLYEKTTILAKKEEILQEIYRLIKINSSNETKSEPPN